MVSIASPVPGWLFSSKMNMGGVKSHANAGRVSRQVVKQAVGNGGGFLPWAGFQCPHLACLSVGADDSAVRGYFLTAWLRQERKHPL